MLDRDPSEFNEIQMVLIPVIVEAVGAIVFISCSILLVAVLSSSPVPV